MMSYDVLITPVNGHFQATVVSLPNVVVEAPTRQEATADLLASSEWVKIDLDVAPRPEGLAALSGMWQENELFDEWLAAIQAYRQEVDARQMPMVTGPADVRA